MQQGVVVNEKEKKKRGISETLQIRWAGEEGEGKVKFPKGGLEQERKKKKKGNKRVREKNKGQWGHRERQSGGGETARS